MFGSGLVLKSGFPAEKVLKSIRFGQARGLTQTAKQAQAGVQGALKGAFTLRGRWFEQQTPFGIKVTAATPAKLVATVHSAADWLIKQEAGGTYFPYKNFFAVPTANVRPKGSTKIIRAALRPGNLKNAFVIVTKKTGARLLCVRKGRGKKKDLVPMYLLIPKAKIKPVEIFHTPIQKVVDRRLAENVQKSIQDALDTMR